MPPRKRYNEHLRDINVDVPTRTKYRLKHSSHRSDGVEPLASALSPELDSSVERADTCSQDEPSQQSDDENIGASSFSSASDDGIAIADDAISMSSVSTSDSSDGDDDDDGNGVFPTSQGATTDSYVYPGCRITCAESLLLLMGHSLRHCTSREATESLLQVVEAHLPHGSSFPTTKYLFFKEFGQGMEGPRMFFYCKRDKSFLGKAGTAAQLRCPSCNEDCSVEEMTKEGHYFLVLDIESQIRDILQDKDSSLQFKEKERALDVSDITQSKAYSEFGMGTDDVSVSWNTDGVPLFESSKFSIWPLQLQLNELPFKYRIKRILLAGLWFGEQKPDTNCFLKPFVDELNRLSSEGLSWTNSDGLSKRTRVFPGPCVCDTVARAMIMNMTQFNGAHGCAWCEQKGEVVQKGDGHVRVYPVESLKGKMRNDVSMRCCAREAEKKKMPVLGVKGNNILFRLSFFKFPSSFVVDYMHAVCSGFVRHTAFMWFDHKKAHPYSIGGSISCIDDRLSGLQPVFEMPRLPRSLAHKKYWKSSEWRNWLLFFSPVVLLGILPQPYYNNWMKFVSMMHVLLADSVPSELLRSAQKHMFSFLKEYEVLYGKQNITFNAHSLLHLVDSVRQWGPLWNFSAYPYENMNGRLVRLVNGTRHAQWQIVEKFLILLAMPKLCATRVISSSPVNHLFTAMLKGYRLRVHCTVLPEYTLIGKGQRTSLGIEYKKIVVAGFTINVSVLDKSRRTNSYVQVKSDEPVFGQVTSIARVPCENHVEGCHCNVIFFLRKLSVKNKVIKHEISPTTRNIYLVEPTSTFMEVNVNRVKKCVGVTVEGKLYVSSLERNYVLEVV